MERFSKYDIEKIEEYWINHKEHKEQMKYLEHEMSQGNAKEEKQKLYKNLKIISEAIDNLYATFDEDLKTIVDMRYWYKYHAADFEEIADKLFMSRSKVLRKRNLLISKTAQLIGWI